MVDKEADGVLHHESYAFGHENEKATRRWPFQRLFNPSYCICWMPASSQPLEPSAGLTRFQTSWNPSGAAPGASRSVPEKRTLAQCRSFPCWPSVVTSSRSASSDTTSVCCATFTDVRTSLLSSSNISCVASSRISSRLPASFAAWSLMKLSFAPRRKLTVSKPAGMLAVCASCVCAEAPDKEDAAG